MASIAIVGAGISGPAAALALAKSGHTVTVYERRDESQLRSNGILGITVTNYQRLRTLGADLTDVQVDRWIHKDGHWTFSEYVHVTWTDVHTVIMNAAIDAGVTFKFGSSWGEIQDSTEFDYFVNAGGVYQASKSGNHPDYSGYVVMRAVSPLQSPEMQWNVEHDPQSHRYLLNMGRLGTGTSWAMFVHRESPVMRTVYQAEIPPETDLLPEYAQRIIRATTEPIQVAPISDWDVPESLWRGTNLLQIGDANGAMRPHTSMGANLGISEGLLVPALLDGSQSPYGALNDRRIQRLRGIQMGESELGM
jgi:2-polyprenyl-6-methoxyphenol hydroxylase-like FAD-dependent oxidoreductase